MQNSSATASSEGIAATNRAGAWWTLIILTLAYILSFVDRLAISVLVEPIKQDLGLSDIQIGLVQGLAFAVFYAIMGLPLGRIADLHNRRWLIVVGVLLWSVATAATGLAMTFAAIFAARVLVGVGEASLSPAAYSMFSDLFSRERLARAIGVYTTGGVLGSGLALLAGSAVLAHFSSKGGGDWPIVGTLAPWQSTFVAIGLPGVVLALIIALTVREPDRKGDVTRPSIKEVLMYVRQEIGTYGAIFAAFALLGIVAYAYVSWAPTYLVRRFGIEPSQAGMWFGGVMLTAGVIGPLAGGAACDALLKRGKQSAPLLVMGVLFTLIIPVAALGFSLPSREATIVAMALLSFAFTAMLGLPHVAIQLLSPNRMRGQVAGLNLMISNIVGIGVAPVLVPLAARGMFGGEIGPAMSLVMGLAAAAGALVAWSASVKRSASRTVPA
jgi:MFS family permease